MIYMGETHDPVNAILDRKLFLGDRHAASSLGMLKSLGVTHVVNAAEELPNYFPGQLTYYRCNLNDDMTERIEFEGPLQFISQALSSGGVVFVHCAAGVSRSASITIAYLMRAHGMGFAEAMRLVEQRRPVINPNPNYLRQLEQFGATRGMQSMSRYPSTSYSSSSYPSTSYSSSSHPSTSYSSSGYSSYSAPLVNQGIRWNAQALQSSFSQYYGQGTPLFAM